MSQPADPWLQELLDASGGRENMTEKQIRILTAAVEVFAEKGYAASSTSNIAQRAGVAEGTIFRHYKTKKDLLYSIVAPLMTKLIAPFVIREFGKVLDAPYVSFGDFLRAVFENRIQFARRHLPLLKILLQEIPFHLELREQFVENVGKKVFDRILPIIEKFQAEGQIAPLPPITVARLAFTPLLGFVILRYIGSPDEDWNDEAEIEATIRFVVRGLKP